MASPRNFIEETKPSTSAKATQKISIIHLSPLSMTSNKSRAFCRICHEGGNLISPCRCSGSVGLIHAGCLEKWLSMSNNTSKSSCEICGHPLKVVHKARPLSQVSVKDQDHADSNKRIVFFQWVCSSTGRRNIIADFVCFLVLTPLAFLSATLCAMGYLHYHEKRNYAEANGLICLTVLLMAVYALWMSLIITFHVREYREWKSTNQEVKLAETGQESSEPAAPVSYNSHP